MPLALPSGAAPSLSALLPYQVRTAPTTICSIRMGYGVSRDRVAVLAHCTMNPYLIITPPLDSKIGSNTRPLKGWRFPAQGCTSVYWYRAENNRGDPGENVSYITSLPTRGGDARWDCPYVPHPIRGYSEPELLITVRTFSTGLTVSPFSVWTHARPSSGELGRIISLGV